MARFVTLLGLACLSGCLTFDADIGEDLVDCTSQEECDVAWSEGVAWIAEAADFYFATQTDLVAQSYCGTYVYETRPCYRMLRTVEAKGKGEIQIRVWCRNRIYCYPSAINASVELTRKVRGAIDRYRTIRAADERAEEIDRTGSTPTPKDLFPRK